MTRKRKPGETTVKFHAPTKSVKLIQARMKRLGIKTYAELFIREGNFEQIINANWKAVEAP